MAGTTVCGAARRFQRYPARPARTPGARDRAVCARNRPIFAFPAAPRHRAATAHVHTLWFSGPISGSGGPGRSWVVPLEPSGRPGGDGGGGGVRGPPTPALRAFLCISGSGGPGTSWVVPLEPSRRPGGDGGGGGVRGPPTPSLRAFLCARRGSAGVRGVPAAEGCPWDWETVLGWWGSRPRPSRTPLGRVAAFQGGLGGSSGVPEGREPEGRPRRPRSAEAAPTVPATTSRDSQRPS